MSDTRPSRDRTRCHECGHLASFHRGPRCLGSIKHDVGFFVSNDDRCPCTLSVEQAREKGER